MTAQENRAKHAETQAKLRALFWRQKAESTDLSAEIEATKQELRDLNALYATHLLKGE